MYQSNGTISVFNDHDNTHEMVKNLNKFVESKRTEIISRMRTPIEINDCSNPDIGGERLLTEESMPSFRFINQNVIICSKYLFSQKSAPTSPDRFIQKEKEFGRLGNKKLLGKGKAKQDPYEFDFENVYAPTEYDKEYKLCWDI